MKTQMFTRVYDKTDSRNSLGVANESSCVDSPKIDMTVQHQLSTTFVNRIREEFVKMAKVISQETYDEVIGENIVMFSMSVEEARQETIEQFEAQVSRKNEN